MLYLNLKQVISERGIADANRFLVHNGFTPYAASRILNHKVDSISYKNLEKLCLALHCTPDALLSWEKPKDRVVAAEHPLHKLLLKAKNVDIAQKLRELPLEKLEEIRKFIEEMPKV